MRGSRGAILLVMLAAAGGACGSEPAAPAPASFAALLDQGMPAQLDVHRVPGAAVALVENGAVAWSRSYGVAIVETRTPVSPDTVFQAASVSKSLTAWGVLRLAERGALDLDAPVERYLTRWHLPPSGFDAGGVTARRILSHTAGLSVHGYEGYLPGSVLPTLEQSLTGPPYPVRIVAQPGSGMLYSGGGYTLLQLVVEEVTGETFADFMQREVLGLLGMQRSSFRWEPALQPATAGAYDGSMRRVQNYLFTEQAAAGLYTTAEDLARFIAAGVAAPGREPGAGVVSPAGVALMHSPSAATGGSNGLGHVLVRVPGHTAVGHDGGNIGWKCSWVSIPARSAGIVVLTNGDNGEAVKRYANCAWYREVLGVSVCS